MKKIIALLFMMIVTLTTSAQTYKAFFDAATQSEVNLKVQVNTESLVIGTQRYGLRRMGTITNSGFTFNSYVFGNDRMFCVSTTQITVELYPGKTITGYMIFIDQRCYLAKKVSY